MGETGTGKTYSIKTIVEAGIIPFVLFTDPGMETISEFAGTAPECKIHWKYIPPATPSWAAMEQSAKKINTLSFKALTELGDINKSQYGQLIEVYGTLSNFTCERCGRSFGAVDSWKTDRALIIDNLTGISQMAMKLVVGSKPVKTMGNWGIAMDLVQQFVEKLSTNLECLTVLICHLEREHDEVTGGIKLMASTLGKKLAPQLPRTFSDVLETVREGTEWTWRTDSVSVATKTRNLPVAGKLPPTFVSIIDSWQKRGGHITLTET